MPARNRAVAIAHAKPTQPTFAWYLHELLYNHSHRDHSESAVDFISGGYVVHDQENKLLKLLLDNKSGDLHFFPGRSHEIFLKDPFSFNADASEKITQEKYVKDHKSIQRITKEHANQYDRYILEQGETALLGSLKGFEVKQDNTDAEMRRIQDKPNPSDSDKRTSIMIKRVDKNGNTQLDINEKPLSEEKATVKFYPFTYNIDGEPHNFVYFKLEEFLTFRRSELAGHGLKWIRKKADKFLYGKSSKAGVIRAEDSAAKKEITELVREEDNDIWKNLRKGAERFVSKETNQNILQKIGVDTPMSIEASSEAGVAVKEGSGNDHDIYNDGKEEEEEEDDGADGDQNTHANAETIAQYYLAKSYANSVQGKDLTETIQVTDNKEQQKREYRDRVSEAIALVNNLSDYDSKKELYNEVIELLISKLDSASINSISAMLRRRGIRFSAVMVGGSKTRKKLNTMHKTRKQKRRRKSKKTRKQKRRRKSKKTRKQKTH